MSGEQALERSVLERKERDELQTIAEALGVKPGSRTKKADLIAQILTAAGVEPSATNGEAASADTPAEDKPKRTRARKAAAPAADGEGGDAGASPASDAGEPTVAASVETSADVPAPTNGSTDHAPTTIVAPSPEESGAPAEARTGGGGGGGGGGQQSQQQQRNEPRQRQGGGGGGGGGQNPGGGNQRQQPGNFEGGDQARRSRRRRRGDRERDRDVKVQEQNAEQQYQGELLPVVGMLDLTDQGYGFLRTKGYLPHADDMYVSTSQARRFALRKGDYLEGAARPAMGSEKYGALLRIDKVCGMTVEEARSRRRFEDLTALFPDMKLHMERPGMPDRITGRIIDLICPIGKGQRGMIVSPPKAGKTTVIKEIATAIEANHPEVHLIVLLVDERPEEVTDMRRTVTGEVVSSTFDRPSEEHTIVAELALERAKRLVELGQDVVIICDGITRLARAYNLSAPASGRLTSGGIDQAAIYPPKRFFGAARNIEEGGSLTILATALVEDGSKAHEVIFEEFKGTGNMELRLDRRLAERRVYPAIDVNASSTRHEELLFDGRKQLDLVWRLRRVLNALGDDGTSAKALELLIEKLKTTGNNEVFLQEVAQAQGATI